MEDLNFKNDNPGAVRYGNYINYYQFHSVEDRIKSLPTTIWNESEYCHALDLGCNAGDLTVSLHQFLTENVSKNSRILGVDIDNCLIERALEKTTSKNIKFIHLDFMNEKQRTKITDYLANNSISRFDIVFCYSITMWIHLNYGDDGLKEFLRAVSMLGELIVIEPQPWKCYGNAVKRMKSVEPGFPLFKELKFRKDVEKQIEKFLAEECDCEKIYESNRICWNRKTVVFKSKGLSQVALTAQ